MSVKTSFELHPTIHYLDIIAKLTSQGSTISDLSLKTDIYNKKEVFFNHKLEGTDILCKEYFQYAENGETLLLWNTYINEKVFNIYKS